MTLEHGEIACLFHLPRLCEDGSTGSNSMDAGDRNAAEARWLELTRDKLPTVAPSRGWPVTADHCFQRIFLDNACEGIWYDHVVGRPAYTHADRALLDRAVRLAEAVLAGTVDLAVLNGRSLAWRRRRAAGR